MKALKKGNECKDDEGIKIYDIKRRNSKNKENSVVNKNKEIKIFALFCDADKESVLEIETKLKDKNIIFVNEMDYADENLAKQNSILRCCDYMLVLVSNSYLKDYYSMNVLAKNYKKDGRNIKVIPIVIEKSIYEPEQQAKLEKDWEERFTDYQKEFFDGDFKGKAAERLREMQIIKEMIGCFVEFSIQKDPKSSLAPFKKLIMQIEKNKKGIIEERKEVYVENYYDKCQINQAKGHGKIKAKQVNGMDLHSALDALIKAMAEELEGMQSQDAESAKDALELLKDEMEEEKPRKSRINKCFRLLSTAVQAINHAPALLENLQKLKQYIEPYM